MIIGIDADEVCNPMSANYVDALRRHHPEVDVPHNFRPSQWDFFNDLGVSRESFLVHLLEHQEHIFCNERNLTIGDPEEERQAIESLQASGHKVLLVTHRDPKLLSVTARWLEKVNYPFDGVVQMNNSVCKTSVDMDFHIDDSPRVINSFVDEHASGNTKTEVVCCSRPWNQNVSGDVKRVNGIVEYSEYILSK